MRYCEKCRANIRSGGEYCPLCQGRLTGEPEASVFPDISYVKKGRKLFKFILLILLVAAVICVVVNISIPETGYWSLLVVAGFVSFIVSFSMLLHKRRNVYKMILWQVAILSVIGVLWDVITGFRGWSTQFVIPIMSTAAMAAMAIIAQATHMHIGDYIIYLIIDAAFAFVPLILVVTGINKVTLPSYICIGASVISLGTLMIFEGKALRAEIRRRLHL